MVNRLCATWSNLCDDWDNFVRDIEKSPLGFFVFLIILIVSIITSYYTEEIPLIFVGWVAAFFAYRRAKAVEYGMYSAQKSRLDDRFIQSCNMLGNKKSDAAKIGGLINLDRLARQEKKDYRRLVFEIVCCFIKEKTTEEKILPFQKAVDIFFKKQENELDHYYKDLHADLSGAKLKEIDFSLAYLSHANLIGAELANVKKARLDYANMSKSTITISHLQQAETFEHATVPKGLFDRLSEEHTVNEGEDYGN